MRNSPEGRIILEEICNMELAQQIDDTLYLHTDPTPEILSYIVDTNKKQTNIGEKVDQINHYRKQ